MMLMALTSMKMFLNAVKIISETGRSNLKGNCMIAVVLTLIYNNVYDIPTVLSCFMGDG